VHVEEVLHLLFIVFQLIRASLNKILQKATHIRQRISHTEYSKLEKKCIQKVRANHVTVSSLRISTSSSSLSDFLGSKCQYNTPISAKQNSKKKLKMDQLFYIGVLIQNKSLSLSDFLNNQITLLLPDYILNVMFTHKVIFVARSGNKSSRNGTIMNESLRTRTNQMKKSTLKLGEWQELPGPPGGPLHFPTPSTHATPKNQLCRGRSAQLIINMTRDGR
jgi:hypothetical protein